LYDFVMAVLVTAIHEFLSHSKEDVDGRDVACARASGAGPECPAMTSVGTVY